MSIPAVGPSFPLGNPGLANAANVANAAQNAATAAQNAQAAVNNAAANMGAATQQNLSATGLPMPQNSAAIASGDLGEIADDGFLSITGRKKELIVTASGKNVSPAPLEDSFRGHPLVSNVVVIGDKKPFVSALVTLDREMLPTWLANHKLPLMDPATAAVHPAVQESLMKGAQRASATVSRAESIRKVRVIIGDFTVDNGLLTPSLKVRRELVIQKYAKEIEAIYAK